MTSLDVHVLVGRNDAARTVRMCDSLIDALSRAAASRGFGWAIVVELAEGVESMPEADRLSAAALDARGSLDLLAGVAGSSEWNRHQAFAAKSAAETILTLSSGAIVAASTVERLWDRLSEGETGEDAFAARELPVGVVAVSESVCAMWRRATLAEASSPDALVVCDEASCVRDARLALVGLGDDLHEGRGTPLAELAVAAFAGASDLVEAALATRRAPLHSIVVRTQGARPEPLREALLCLANQTDERCEVILVAHDADMAAVSAVVADQPRWLQQRLVLVEAHGGSRAHPLNVGIAAARGSIVSFFDDDDLAFAHWVETVLAGAAQHPRQVVRSQVAVQHVAAEPWRGGVVGHVAEQDMDVPYPAVFDLADHLRVNMTPFMAMAFPSSFFDVVGGADEELEVCEDWDLILRAASSLGVVDVGEVTAVYRRWTTGSDSYTIHDQESWDRSMARVRRKIDASALLLPPGSASQLADMSQRRAEGPIVIPPPHGWKWWISAPFRVAKRVIRRRLLRSQ